MGVCLTNNIIQYLNPIKEIHWKLFPLCNHNCTQDRAINYADLSLSCKSIRFTSHTYMCIYCLDSSTIQISSLNIYL